MHSVWAVARNTIAQALRMKVAFVVIIMLLILLPLMSMIMTGDGTLQGKLQAFVSYGLSLTSLLLCLLTIIVSTYTLADDLDRKHIYLVITKPIARFQILCGKLLGVVLLDIFLLAVFASIIYGLTLMMPKISDPDQVQLVRAQNEFFTARRALAPAIDEEQLKELALRKYEKLEKSGQLPERMSSEKIHKELLAQERFKAKAVETAADKVWEFENVRVYEPNEILFIRYKFEVATRGLDERVLGRWIIGDYRQLELGPGKWRTPLYKMDRADTTNNFHEFTVPATVIAEDGYLAVAFQNPVENRTTLIMEELEVLYRADSFTANYCRSILLILVRLIFLAALGISVSTWLSFPVAILVSVVVFFIGTINGFVLDSFTYLGYNAGLIYNVTFRPLLWLLPKFDGKLNPTEFIVPARLLGWTLLLKAYCVTIFIKAFLLVIFGMLIFSGREIAKISR
jgi:hypothetical protein